MTGMLTTPYQDFAREHLGFEFKDIQLLITALTHRSYVNEHKKSVTEHNERFEFLGDAVLELVVTDYLFKNFTEQEGILTSWRAALARTGLRRRSGLYTHAHHQQTRDYFRYR
jgi:ribonuclease-3